MVQFSGLSTGEETDNDRISSSRCRERTALDLKMPPIQRAKNPRLTV
jgi:hypothetical protein